MANSSLGTLTVDLVANTSNWVKGMDASERAAVRFRRQVDRSIKQLERDIERGLKKATGIITAAGAGLAALAAKSADVVSSQAKLARSVNISYDSLTALKTAANNVSFQGLDSSLVGFSQRIGEAQQGMGKASKSLEALGINVKELGKLKADEQMAKIASRIREIGYSTNEAAKFLKDFGFTQAESLEFFNEAADNIEAYKKEVQDLGLAMDEISLAKIETATNATGTLQRILTGIGGHLAAEFAPLVTEIEEGFKGWTQEMGGAEVIAKTISTTIVDIANAADTIFNGIATTINLTIVGLEIALNKLFIKIADFQPKYNALIDFIGKRAGGLTGKAFGMLPKIELFNETDLADTKKNLEVAVNTLDNLLAGYEKDRVKNRFEIIVNEAEARAKVAVEQQRSAAKSEARGIQELGESYEKLLAVYDRRQALLNSYQEQLEKINKSQATQAQKTELLALAAERYKEELEKLGDVKIIEIQTKSFEELLGQYNKHQAALNRLNKELKDIAEARLSDAQAMELEKLAMDRFNESIKESGSFWDEWLEKAEEAMKTFKDVAADTISSFESNFATAFENVVTGAESWRDAMSSLLENVLRSIIRGIGEMIAQWITYGIVQKTVGRSIAGASAIMQATQAQAMSMQAGLNAYAATAAIPLVGPAAAPAAMAAALAATQPMAAGIQALNLKGMAHDGIQSVPETGTWLLERGERVLSSKTSAKLDKMISGLTGGARQHAITQNINVTGSIDSRTADQIAWSTIQQAQRVSSRFARS